MSYLSEFIDFKKTIAGEVMRICLSPGMQRICGRFNTELSVRVYIGLNFLIFFFPNKYIHTNVIQQNADIGKTFPFLLTLPSCLCAPLG